MLNKAENALSIYIMDILPHFTESGMVYYIKLAKQLNNIIIESFF